MLIINKMILKNIHFANDDISMLLPKNNFFKD